MRTYHVVLIALVCFILGATGALLITAGTAVEAGGGWTQISTLESAGFSPALWGAPTATSTLRWQGPGLAPTCVPKCVADACDWGGS
jgi:hypothetical protein